MHSALLIDEVLELILDHCSAGQNTQDTKVFYQLARCCKSWKDPALNRLWTNLDSLSPLLALLPQCTAEVDPVAAGTPFSTYARRIKHLHLKSRCPALSVSPLGPMIMPNLRTVSLSTQTPPSYLAWIMSPSLQSISADIGFSCVAEDAVIRSDAIATYLIQVHARGSDLHSLRIRGQMTPALSLAVATFSQLRSLILHTTSFLTNEDLAVIATFPRLRSFDVHARGITSNGLRESLCAQVSPFFPSLEDLRIAAEVSVLREILDAMPPGTLKTIRYDGERSSDGTTSISEAFQALAQKASTSLEEFTWEDMTQLEDVTEPALPRLAWYTISSLAPLAELRFMRRFSLVTAYPPDLSDEDLGRMAKWWPSLEHLDLGLLHPEELPATWNTRITPAAYSVVADAFPSLRYLALPVSFSSSTAPTKRLPSTSSHGLETLVVAYVPEGAACVEEFAGTIRTCFPSMVQLDGPAELVERCGLARND